MTNFYTLDLGIGITGDEYRLEQTRNWRRFNNWENPISSDLSFKHYDQLVEEKIGIEREGQVLIGDSQYRLLSDNPVSFAEISKAPHIFPRIHRSSQPKTPTRKDLEEIVRNGKDDRNMILVLDVDGEFQLYLADFAFDRIKNYELPVVASYETFLAGNGYLGPDAAKDKAFIENTFLCFLEGWLAHLKSGALGIYESVCSLRSEREIMRDIENASRRFLSN